LRQAGDVVADSSPVTFHSTPNTSCLLRSNAASQTSYRRVRDGVQAGHTSSLSDFSDDFFHQIFDGDDARDRSLLIPTIAIC